MKGQRLQARLQELAFSGFSIGLTPVSKKMRQRRRFELSLRTDDTTYRRTKKGGSAT